jgi:serine/threonine-protein kinase RsbW
MVSSAIPSIFLGNEPEFNHADCHCLTVRTIPDVRCFMEQLGGELHGAGFSDKEVFGMRLAVEEAVVNGIKHGNGGDPNKQVQVRYRITADQVLVMVQDEGPGFDPDDVPDPRDVEFVERACGRGVFLMRSFMTWVQFKPPGNLVTMCKQKGA